jgi:hypothetical protein
VKKKIKDMKTNIIKSLIFCGLFILSAGAFAQAPPPPPGEHGSGTNESGGGAPIGSGIAILLSLGAAYGGKKMYNVWNNKEEPDSKLP